jgi:hypothetical protein
VARPAAGDAGAEPHDPRRGDLPGVRGGVQARRPPRQGLGGGGQPAGDGGPVLLGGDRHVVEGAAHLLERGVDGVEVGEGVARVGAGQLGAEALDHGAVRDLLAAVHRRHGAQGGQRRAEQVGVGLAALG